jgi:hypothetical protein
MSRADEQMTVPSKWNATMEISLTTERSFQMHTTSLGFLCRRKFRGRRFTGHIENTSVIIRTFWLKPGEKFVPHITLRRGPPRNDHRC